MLPSLVSTKRDPKKINKVGPTKCCHCDIFVIDWFYLLINLCLIPCVIDHAHPTLVAGHPFKAYTGLSSGYLLHPEMFKFQLNTPYLFAPPNPAKVVGAAAVASSVPSFSNFFSAYFGGRTYQLTDTKCGKYLEGMKRCYENNIANADSACTYYVDGFKRLACSQ